MPLSTSFCLPVVDYVVIIADQDKLSHATPAELPSLPTSPPPDASEHCRLVNRWASSTVYSSHCLEQQSRDVLYVTDIEPGVDRGLCRLAATRLLYCCPTTRSPPSFHQRLQTHLIQVFFPDSQAASTTVFFTV
jgi:hypothetical protein